jgi:16S rRNA (cytidine1402-2'-O)-methyltransferase
MPPDIPERYSPKQIPGESVRDRRLGSGGGKSQTPGARGEILQKPVLSAGQQLHPGLYLTATPIGNAADITLRALNILRDCDAIVAEDTRVTSRLLSLHGIARPLLVYNDHNAASMRGKLLARLGQGARLALVSDAGTPLVSDPGYKLVREALEQGIRVVPVPGPSAALAALVASGLPTDRFLFAGFLPSKAGERRSELAALRGIPSTLVIFESAQRLAASLADMAEIFGPRQAAVARELTKLHEEVRRGTLDELARAYAGAPPKGEVVVVIAPPSVTAPDQTRVDALLHQALPFMPVKAAAALVADATGASRTAAYERALLLKRDPDEPEA